MTRFHVVWAMVGDKQWCKSLKLRQVLQFVGLLLLPMLAVAACIWMSIDSAVHYFNSPVSSVEHSLALTVVLTSCCIIVVLGCCWCVVRTYAL